MVFLIVPQLLQSVLGLSPSNDVRMGSALVAFSLFEAAYYAEIIRARNQSVAPGQMSAALADFFGRAYGIGERDGRIVEMLLFAGLVYFVICFSASLAVKFLSRKTAP